MKKFLSSILLLTLFFACNPATADQEGADANAATATDTTSSANSTATGAAPAEVQHLTAKFVEFTLGDAPHFIFEDKAGKTWDFGGCDDQQHQFERELPASEADVTNQGYGSNKKLQGKWFDLKYTTRNQPLYLEGPMGDVPVILEAKLVQ